MLSAPANPPLRDYQKAGVNWLLSRLLDNRAVLLADDAGLGKTLQALTAAEHSKQILIVSPAGARRVWQNEIHRWFPDWDNRVVLIEPGGKTPSLSNLAPMIVIVGYDELSNLKSQFARQLRLIQWDLLILDEAHFLKNPSNRTQAIYGRGHDKGLQAHAEKVILLTGTPTPNHAGELWQHYRALWPEALGPKPLSQDQFEDRFTKYKNTVFGRQVTGSKNQAKLRQALGPMVLRRRKAEVLTELPPLILQDIPLDYSTRQDPLVSTTPFISSRLQAADDDELLRILRSPDTQLATARRELGELKALPTILWAQERMQSVNKLLLFAWHHSVIAHLARGLLEFSPVVITGETSPALRAANIQAFQRSPGQRIFIGQILAAGTAITLTAASEVAIVEPSWVPGENYQAICRAHRLGQRDSVLASFLFLPGTLDERIMQTFRRKAAEISELEKGD